MIPRREVLNEARASTGRLRAYEKLWADARSNKATQQWSEIPAVVIHDQTDYGIWGRNLSENKLRSFNWTAECVCFARMKGSGKHPTEIAKIFGLESEKDVLARIALGGIPGLEKLHPGVNVSFHDARDYILPLRGETGRNPDNGNERVYDYSEVTTAIDKLVDGQLTRDDLPTYSAERRVAIKEAQQDARLKEIAAKQAETKRLQA